MCRGKNLFLPITLRSYCITEESQMYQRTQQKYETPRREGGQLLQYTSIDNDLLIGFWSLDRSPTVNK